MKPSEKDPPSDKKNNSPLTKGKSSSGRKPGYKMKTWQKDIQLASLRNRDLENFNIFLNDFAALFTSLKGEIFFMTPKDSRNETLFPKDHIYVMEQVTSNKKQNSSEVLYLFINTEEASRKLCLKTHELYIMVRDNKLFPAKEKTRKFFLESLMNAVYKDKIRFPEQEIISRNIKEARFEEIIQLAGILNA